MDNLNYRHLYYFYVIAREQSVSAAAKELRVSQPALSSQLKRFEDQLGVKLFDRAGRRMVLTEEGRHTLAYAETIFNAGRELADSLKDRSEKGRLRVQVGISDSIPKDFADYFLRMLFKMEPGLHLTVYENRPEDMLEDLRNHVLDLVLSDVPAKASSEEGIENHLAARVPILFCVHKSLASKYRRFPEDLNQAPLILPTAHSQIFHSVQEFFTARGVLPRIVAEVQDVELVSRMVLSKIGVAPLSRFQLSNPLFRKSVKVLDKGKPSIWGQFYLIIRKRTRQNPLVEKLLAERERIFERNFPAD